MRRLSALFMFLVSINSLSQNLLKVAAEIELEGKELYKSEMASWHGTDLFLEAFKDRTAIGGYFSYLNNGQPTCIFFEKGERPKVIGTMTFDDTFDLTKAKVDLSEREFSKLENDYFKIRQAALSRVTTDTIFKFYKNSSPNLIPIIFKKEKKVYVLTGYSGKEKIVIYGNDYLITFNKKDEVKAVKKLHAAYLPFNYGNEGDKISVAGMHTHIEQSGEFMSATDVCTTMMYQNLTNWKNYYVMSDKYVSIWDCEKAKLVIMTKDAWEKISSPNEKK